MSSFLILQGLEHLRRNFDEAENGQRLIKSLVHAVEHREARRQGNFVGVSQHLYMVDVLLCLLVMAAVLLG